MKPINVTKPFLPPYDEFCSHLKQIWDGAPLTNQGPLLQELEDKLRNYLEVENFHFLTNGTLALQLALSALEIDDGEIITTPFSYVATTSSIMWQRCKPVFVDIELDNFTIDANKIEASITPKTKAIMAVHVFGYPCDVERIQSIANRHNIKVIYDGAHAFGVRYKGKSLLEYGDIATLSFHATKLFHTIEGGACIVKEKQVSERLDYQKKFGHIGDEHFMLGINAKANEFQAAMGLCNFPYIGKVIAERKRVSNLYDNELSDIVTIPKKQKELEYNYAYYPVVFKSETEMLKAFEVLNKENIYPRRYFYPSLNKLPYVKYQSCPVSESISSRVACLPLYPDLSKEDVWKICKILKEAL